LLGTTQAQVSALMRCKPVSVSVGRLMEFLNVLGQDVEVTVKPAQRRKPGNMSVVVQAV
jgi:predicted XRE-type DNA-binding protein